MFASVTLAQRVVPTVLYGSAVCLGACAIGDFDLEDRSCPCTDGYVCDLSANRCVRAFTVPDATTSVDATTPSDAGTAEGDAALSDAGGAAPDMGIPDTGLTPSDSRCDSDLAARAFCDGFESPGLQGWGSMVNTGTRGGPSMVEVQSDIVYRGRGALKASVGANSEQAAVWAEVFAVPAPDEVWARGYFYLPLGLADGAEYIGLSDPRYDKAVVTSVDSVQSDLHTHAFDNNPFVTFLDPFPRDQWVCVELHSITTEMGLIEVYWDGELKASESFDGRNPTGFNRINVGFVDWRSQVGQSRREVYADEIVVDTMRIHCD